MYVRFPVSAGYFRSPRNSKWMSTSWFVFLFLVNVVSPMMPRDIESTKELILIVNVDTLRCDELGIYGNERHLTPHLDELANKAGVIFDEAFAASDHTRPSVVSLFMGLYPTNHGFWHFKSILKTKEPNIATVMPRDFVTIYVNANPNLSFGEYFQYSWSERAIADPKYTDCAYYPAEYVFNKAYDFLRVSNFPNKAFVYIQPADPHDPYYPLKPFPDLFEGDELRDKYSGKWKSELDGIRWDENLSKRTSADIKNLKNRYDAEVRYLDEQLFQFWENVRRYYQKALLVFTSDHGESFLDHLDAGHGSSLYNEQIKIPFIIIDTEKRFGKPRRTDDLISNVDLLPTLAEVVGFGSNLKSDGLSLMKLKSYFAGIFPLKKSRTIVSEVLHSSETIDVDSITDSKTKNALLPFVKKPISSLIRATVRHERSFFKKTLYKYIKNENPDEAKLLLLTKKLFFQQHNNELYLLNSDPKEQINRYGISSGRARDILNTSPLKGRYPEFFSSEKKLSKEEIELLKSLGYIK
jgi:hypothetical protein